MSALVWVSGLLFLLFHSEGRRYRLLGITYLVFLGVMMAMHGKAYYLAPAYPMLFAAGGVVGALLTESHRRFRFVRFALPALILLTNAVILPTLVPVLSPEKYIAYSRAVGFTPSRSEVEHAGPLPQHLGDMLGWPEMVETVAKVYHGLPDHERAKAAILANNYGEAGAIDFFGPRHGLPKAISGHQTYYFWGPREYTGEVVILLQWSRKRAEQLCSSVEEAAQVGHPYGMSEEHYTVLVCRDMKPSLQELWPRLKNWN